MAHPARQRDSKLGRVHRPRMTHFSAAQRRLVILGRARQALGVPNFSCKAAFLLDAMAALPRKSDLDGAASLPWQTIALPRGGAIRKKGGFIVLA